MPEETVVAASSAVQESPVSYEIPRSGTPEYTEWRTTGNLPEKTKPQAESAPADAPEKTAPEDAVDSAATTQEQEQREKSKRRPDVEERFKRLTDEKNARILQLEKELESHRAKPTQAESSPAKPEPPQQPQTYTDWRKAFDADAWESKYINANPEVKYAEVHAAMADYLADVRDNFRSREQAAQAASKEIAEKTEQVRSRYGEEFSTILEPTADALMGDKAIPPDVKRMIALSDVLPELLHAIGSDPKKMEKLVQAAKTDPLRAYRYIATLEAGIQSETSKGNGEPATRNEKGQYAKVDPPPAKRGPESAPEPPISIGSRGAGPMDESERAFKAIKSGDLKATRSWLEAENKKLNSARRGF